MAHAPTGLVGISEKHEHDGKNELLGSTYTVPVPISELPDEEFREHQYRQIQDKYFVLRKLGQAERWLDRKVGAEARGIERIPEDEKRPPSIWNIFLLWWSLNIHVGVIPLGLLGPAFGLSFRQSIWSTLLGNALGAVCTAFDGTLAPKLGLRQIACSRYSFGFWGAKLCSVLNIVVGGGYFVVNLVVVGQALSAVSDFSLSIECGIVIIAVVSYCISIFGYRLIHTYEKYSWIVTFILLLVLYGQAAPHVDVDAPGLDSGLALAGSILSIISIMFSNASGWCSIAGDYYVNYPASTPFWTIFGLTWAGIFIPVSFSTILGICLGNLVYSGSTPQFTDAYESHGGENLGALLLAVYHPVGWSKFCLVILTFSVLGNNIAINYSSGLSLQVLGHYFHAVPRFIWSMAFAVVVAVLAIVGKSHLATIVDNFVSCLGYWTVAFTIVLFLEDKWFRRHDGYDVNVWDRVNQLPWGIAAVFSLLAAYLAGGVPGMAQTWYVGPIAAHFGEFGGDVGIYLAAAITLVCYLPLRTLEKSYFGK